MFPSRSDLDDDEHKEWNLRQNGYDLGRDPVETMSNRTAEVDLYDGPGTKLFLDDDNKAILSIVERVVASLATFVPVTADEMDALVAAQVAIDMESYEAPP